MKLYSSSNVVVCLIVGLALSPLTVLAQGTTTYSGQATALKATALGISITLADTGPLPSAAFPGREHVWTLRKSGRQVDCELQFHGKSYRWEYRCLHDGELADGDCAPRLNKS